MIEAMRALMLLALCGCWRGGETTETTPAGETSVAAPREQGASCSEAADNVRSILTASAVEDLRSRADQIRTAMIRRCAQDKWSMELRRCLTGAPTLDATDGCEQLATPEQQAALEQEVKLMENAD